MAAMRTIPFKLVLLGDAAVGKSSLVLRFVKRQFFEYQESTIGSAFLSQTVQLEDALIKFEIWDTAGQERYQGLAPMYYRGAAAALVVYDITSVSSFQRAQSWIQELQSQASNNIVILLIGNKTDMAHKRMVSTDMAKSYAEENNVTYFETSAKTNDNVSEVFMHLARTLPRGNDQAKTSNNIVIDSDYKGRKSRCC